MSPPGSEQSHSDSRLHQAPLVIVSQDGRNTQASRRIVRAQAARASAAQSRMTRARNREEREGFQRDAYNSAISSSSNQPGRAFARSNDVEQSNDSSPMPLSVWLVDVALLSATATSQQADSALQRDRQRDPTTFSPLIPMDPVGGAQQRPSSKGAGSFGSSGLRLPLATPKGFASLQHRVAVPDTLLYVLSRTACVDFVSPGVEGRLHELLVDLIVYSAASQPSHPVENHLRVACACLTIFQGQRANGAVFANDPKYHEGLAAAWSEATLLDINALSEPKAAEASLWAIFVIHVTTGATTDFFHRTLQAIFHDLQLRYWEQVRRILLDFIYPVSFLDEPSKVFYESLKQREIAPS